MKKIVWLALVLSFAKAFAQNVGIGTNNPLSKLHVAGCIRSDTLIGPGVRSLFAAPNGRIYDSLVVPSTLNWEINGNSNITPANFLGTTNAQPIIFKTNNTEWMRLISTGQFGIGTPAPSTKFQVIADGGDGISIKSSTTDAGDLIFMEASGLEKGRVYTDGTAGVSALIFSGGSVPASHMYINSIGNVGIGNTTPNNRVEITSSAANLSGLRFTNLTSASNTVTSNGKSLSVDVNGDVILVPSSADAWLTNGNAGTNSAVNFLGTTDAQDLVFKTNGVEHMRLFSNGIFANTGSNIIGSDGQGWNVGAQSSIAWTLNNTGYAGLLYNAGTTPGADGLAVKVAGTNASNVAFDVSSGAQGTAGPSILSALGNGQVGIGTNAPQASALLQIVSTTKGVMFPSMTTAQRQAIVAPAVGLMVYDVTANILMSFNGTRWQEVGGDPIGTIEAFHKNMAATPTLPWGWVECNGQVLADPESPYNGQTIPDLNNTQKFLRGDVTSGTMQTDAIGSHNHTGTTSTDGAHNHTGSTGSVNSTNGRVVPWDDNFSQNQMNAANTGALGNTPAPGGLPWNGLATVGNFLTTIDQLDHTHAISTDGSHSHTFTTSTTGGTETRPTNMSVIWIMRVK
ncbi:MAG: hypothetical protein JST26_02710 [Bacteroidetes bacterium]|nr:hypothetical protein [Bacteroidota bacterium]